ncbi:MAG: hypothetical protein PUB69_03400 [Desulfovibrionaceae bacterium]|nr:hypothetical protein [Desulfovibrionaceae bacterium]
MNPVSQTVNQTSAILNNLKKLLKMRHGSNALNQCVDSAQTSLKEIQSRIEDPNFYIGIVGGFSCGKTTFVNAFIEGETLAADVNQGTTCVGTYVLHGDEEKVLVKYKNGKKKEWTGKGFVSGILRWLGKNRSSIEAFIKNKTANEEESSQIEYVKFYTPSSGLR